MSIICTIILSAIILSAMMFTAWAVQKRTHQSGWADVFWSYAIGIGGVMVALIPASIAPIKRRWLVTAMVAFWSIRLGWHIMVRTFGATYEDPRYADLRKEWGANFQFRIFAFLQIQALCGLGLVVTIFAAAHRPGPALSIADYTGLGLLIISVIGEGVSDAQLRAFTSDKANHGKVCDKGLWSWSRHPNYFFEWLGWVAYPIIAIDLSGGWWQGWLSLIGPAMMYWLLVYASGIPPLEQHMLRSRGEAFKKYQARTSAFFPTATQEELMDFITAATSFVERAPLPDSVTLAGVRYLCGRTQKKLEKAPDIEAAFASTMGAYPIATHTEDANAQHYEVPAAFFDMCLGPRRKYSCCLYADKNTTIEQAEEAALAATAEHAKLEDGLEILELGCGWGSLSLYMAKRYPNAKITAVSNSHSQRHHIMKLAEAQGSTNLNVITCDMNDFVIDQRFDRVVSVEMFEHMSNWEALLTRVNGWLKPDGFLFIHIFTHDKASYRFDHADKSDWIAQHFFTGGIMPSHGLIRHFPTLFEVEEEWRWNGENYARTAFDWLDRFDKNVVAIRKILKSTYGDDAKLWERRWRLFFLATAGLFGFDGGKPWAVSHYRLKPVAQV